MLTAKALQQPYSERGFTLIELMIVVALIAILSAIAVPGYQKYVKKSHAKAVAGDLVSLGLVMENRYQRKLSYGAAVTKSGVSDIQALVKNGAGASPWEPAENTNFTYKLTITEATATTAAGYSIEAKGNIGGMNSGCTLTLTNTNTRTISGGVACGGMSSW